MNAQRRISCFMGIAAMFATASFAQQVKTDYDRNADFSKDKTYSWENVHTENPLWVDRIKAAANSALAAKGWTQVESGGDISVMAMEISQSHQTLNTYYDNFGGGWDGVVWEIPLESPPQPKTRKRGDAGGGSVRRAHEETNLARRRN